MEENRKEPVTFFYKPMGEPEGEGRTLAFPHHLSPNVDQCQPRRTLNGNTKAKDEINQHLLKSCCLVPVLSGRRSKIHQQDFAWDFPGGPAPSPATRGSRVRSIPVSEPIETLKK